MSIAVGDANYRIHLVALATSALAAVGLSVEAAQGQETLGIDPSFSGSSRPYGLPSEATGKGLRAGESTFLYPAIGVSAAYDDNRYRSEDNPQSTNRYNLTPRLVLQGSQLANVWSLGYRGDYATYSKETEFDDDYDDHNVFASIARDGSKARGMLYADWIQGHDERGEDNFESYDTWDQNRVLGDITFGATDARFNLRIDGEYWTRRQDLNQSLDKDVGGVGAALLWRVSGKTQLVAETGLSSYDFKNSNADYDRTYLRGGVTWEATGKTTGIFTIGQDWTDPDSEGQPIVSTEPGPAFGTNEKSSSTSWKALIRWTPTTRDIVSLQSSSGARLSNGVGSARISTDYGIAWDHDWTSRIRSNVGYRFGTDDYKGTDREDDLQYADINLSYKVARSTLLRGSWAFEDRDSSVVGQDYDRNVYKLMLDYEF